MPAIPGDSGARYGMLRFCTLWPKYFGVDLHDRWNGMIRENAPPFHTFQSTCGEVSEKKAVRYMTFGKIIKRYINLGDCSYIRGI